MGVTRFNVFQARPGLEGDVRVRLMALVPRIAELPGCRACELLRSRSDPGRMVVVERWESVAAHQAAVSEVPREEIGEMLTLLDGPPKGEYFDEGAGSPAKEG